MKTLAYYLLGIFSLCILNACSDEESPQSTTSSFQRTRRDTNYC